MLCALSLYLLYHFLLGIIRAQTVNTNIVTIIIIIDLFKMLFLEFVKKYRDYLNFDGTCITLSSVAWAIQMFERLDKMQPITKRFVILEKNNCRTKNKKYIFIQDYNSIQKQ